MLSIVCLGYSFMKHIKLDLNIENSLHTRLMHVPLLEDMLNAISSAGGRPYLVGGAVRDLLLGREIKDLDIEVHGLDSETLEKTLAKFAPINTVGKSFGVIRVTGLDIDWSLPRADSSGRKPQVEVDPNMDIVQALKRRDLTMNAMAIDLIDFDLIDPFGGIKDIKDRILRSPDTNFFVQDPLRFFRVMQFIGRFEMMPDDQLNEVCSTMSLPPGRGQHPQYRAVEVGGPPHGLAQAGQAFVLAAKLKQAVA